MVDYRFGHLIKLLKRKGLVVLWTGLLRLHPARRGQKERIWEVLVAMLAKNPQPQTNKRTVLPNVKYRLCRLVRT